MVLLLRSFRYAPRVASTSTSRSVVGFIPSNVAIINSTHQSPITTTTTTTSSGGTNRSLSMMTMSTVKSQQHQQRREFFWGSSKKKEEENVPSITKEEVRNMFYKWNNALQTLDSDVVAKLYSKNPILLPTISDTPRLDYNSIINYFDDFLKNKPSGIILEDDGTNKIIIGNNWAMDAGLYEFTMGATGDKVKARYTFIYVYEDGEWKISHHHSSFMPEGIVTKAQTLTKQGVQDLFHLWNDALATLDSQTVAKRYAKNAVLLPTLSDTPRTDHELIIDYFNNFLLMKPQGKIIESNVYIGINWAQDAGIYEFTLGATGNKVLVRYSFIYVYEDGEWKIQHHHSSGMPESISSTSSSSVPPPQPITTGEVRQLFHLWNDALATLDPDIVAKRYSKEAALLPTISDIPRTNYDSIKSYFVDFLKRKPQGIIESSNVIIGHNWAQDAGIYEFTLGDTGDKVRARYTFIYIYEDGEWKISHQHSSFMPESYGK